jgi:uncharacterized protein (DUF488 family)
LVNLRTVGHGTLPADDFAALVSDAGIEVVVDVRSFPASRRHPQFGREAMEGWLPDAGVAYRWEPRLGGRRRPRPDSPHGALRVPAFRGYADHMETQEFSDAVDELLVEAGTRRAAVMCAESVWWRCHRRLLADAAVLLRGAAVEHLFHDGRLDPHRPTPEARVDRQRLVYDGGEPGLPLRES